MVYADGRSYLRQRQGVAANRAAKVDQAVIPPEARSAVGGDFPGRCLLQGFTGKVHFFCQRVLAGGLPAQDGSLQRGSCQVCREAPFQGFKVPEEVWLARLQLAGGY
jgi:hypothetical protein